MALGIKKKSLTCVDKALLKISSDIFFLLLNSKIDLIFQHQNKMKGKKSMLKIDQCFSKLT